MVYFPVVPVTIKPVMHSLVGILVIVASRPTSLGFTDSMTLNCYYSIFNTANMATS